MRISSLVTLVSLVSTISCQEWTRYAGYDCYQGNGAVGIPPEPLIKQLTLAQCQDACVEEEGCEGITRRWDQGEGSGVCYLRKSINRDNCVKDPDWDLYEVDGSKPIGSGSKWDVKTGLDCYAGKGGDPIQPDPFSNNLSLQQCQDACKKDAQCEGIIRKSSDQSGAGICYKRKNLQLGKCVKDAAWDLHIKKGSTKPTTTTKKPVTRPTTTKKPVTNNAWERLTSTDCYQGKGGDPILPDPYSKSVTLKACKAACASDSSCQGIIRKSSDGASRGICYKRRNLVIRNCVSDPLWELHKKPNTGGSGTPGTTAKPSTGSYGCKYGIQSYPRNLPNAHYYTRLCTTNNGLKVISANRATDRALERTAFLIDHVMEYVDPRVASSMNARGFRHAVMGAYPSELTTHIPEHAFLDPGFWNERARGLGATVRVPVGSSAEENALCYSNDRYKVEDITIHEFAHSMHLTGLALVFPNFNSELTGLYNAARSRNLWGSGHYAMTDFKEYFAEGVQSFFDTNAPDSYAPTTKDQLRRKDPNFYNFLYRYLGNNNWKRTC